MDQPGRTVVTRGMHAGIKAARKWFSIREVAIIFDCSSETVTRYQKRPLDRDAWNEDDEHKPNAFPKEPNDD